MDRPISEVARLTGITSRTLRHYDDVGLLPPSRVGPTGYRYYGTAALVRLQRILLLRELGMPLQTIREVLDDPSAAPAAALRRHLDHLRGEQQRIERLITAVLTTVRALEEGEEPMPEEMFDGFDHTQHREEVEERWGEDAYAQGDSWWRGLTEHRRADVMREARELGAAWTGAATRGVLPGSEEAQALAARHVAWLGTMPGVPRNDDGSLSVDYVRGLGEMYVADPRFAANYGGQAGAELVRASLSLRVSFHT